MKTLVNRRGALRTFGALAAGGAVSAFAGWTATSLSGRHGPPRTAVRIAHITDVHVHPDGPAGTPRQVPAPRSLPLASARPDSHGGDAVLDARKRRRDEARAQWKLWQSVLRDECRLPSSIVSAIMTSGEVPEKAARPPTRLNGTASNGRWTNSAWAKRFRSFDRSGWHLVVLDSVSPQACGYEARLDDEQFDWLKADLQATPKTTPTLILSHIPILAACACSTATTRSPATGSCPAPWMHLDARRLKSLFVEHPNVRLS